MSRKHQEGPVCLCTAALAQKGKEAHQSVSGKSMCASDRFFGGSSYSCPTLNLAGRTHVFVKSFIVVIRKACRRALAKF